MGEMGKSLRDISAKARQQDGVLLSLPEQDESITYIVFGGARIGCSICVRKDRRTPLVQTVPRIITAFLLGCTISAGIASFGFAADEATRTQTETAAFSPIQEPNATGVSGEVQALPRVLSQTDAALYQDIFSAQIGGDWKTADSLIRQLDDRILMGHVLYQRYMHPTAYRSKYKELKAWMADYAAHPDAKRIYKLAMRRRPANYNAPKRPQSVALPNFDGLEEEQDDASTSAKKGGFSYYAGLTRSQRSKARRIQRAVRRWVQAGSVTKSWKYLSNRGNARVMGARARADSLGVVARGYFRYHLDDKAMKVALEAVSLSEEASGVARWWGGLAAFRAGNYAQALDHFEALSTISHMSADLRAAGAFWASRSAVRARKPWRTTALLKQAAEARHSFYGLMAMKALGIDPPLDWALPRLNDNQAELILRIPAARRSIALIEAGQIERADSELRRFAAELPPSMGRTLLALADKAGLADLSYRLGRELGRKNGVYMDAALYPLPGWRPEDGFSVDRALIFAFARQESRFRARAKSRAGARGLMQLMPATAGFIAKRRFRGAARDMLLEPALNLSLGQKYIEHLFELPEIGDNLLYTMAAYNGGPGNLAKWRKKVDYAGDPLMFIESIPSRETRNYVEYVMANLWIYRHRLGQPAPSLEDLVGGGWPAYRSVDPVALAASGPESQ